MVTLVITNKVK